MIVFAVAAPNPFTQALMVRPEAESKARGIGITFTCRAKNGLRYARRREGVFSGPFPGFCFAAIRRAAIGKAGIAQRLFANPAARTVKALKTEPTAKSMVLVLDRRFELRPTMCVAAIVP